VGDRVRGVDLDRAAAQCDCTGVVGKESEVKKWIGAVLVVVVAWWLLPSVFIPCSWATWPFC